MGPRSADQRAHGLHDLDLRERDEVLGQTEAVSGRPQRHAEGRVLGPDDHSFRSRRICASLVAASANSFAAVAAVSGNLRGCSTDGCSGQVTMTTAGVLPASTSSMASVLCGDAVSWPEARVVTLDAGILLLASWDLRPVGSCELLAGHLLVKRWPC
jgi:hypothetical protein